MHFAWVLNLPSPSFQNQRSSAGSTGPISRGISAPLLHPEKEELSLNPGTNSGVKQQRAQQHVSSNSHFCLPNTANIP